MRVLKVGDKADGQDLNKGEEKELKVPPYRLKVREEQEDSQ